MKKRTGVLLFVFLFSGMTYLSASEWFPEISGWEMQEEKRVYTPSDLWELINGAAEAFLDYGFADLHLAEYMLDDQIVRAEIYRHSTAVNAYGMYAAERMPDYEQVSTGAQGYSSEGILNFFTGPFYVKIMAVGLAEVSAADISRIADQVDQHLGQSSGMPGILTLLPEEGMEYLSDHYVATNFLGYSFLHSAYTATYDKEGRFQLFIIHETPEAIQTMLERYRALLKEDKFRQQGTLMVVSDMFNGTIFLSAKGEYLVGVVNTEDEMKAADYIGKVIDSIP